MTREEIIDGLKFTVDMFLFNPSTGEVNDKNRLNDESRLTVDACEGTIKALEQTRWIPVSERYPRPEDEYKYFLVTDNEGKVSVQEFFISLDKEPQPYFSGMVNVIAWMPLPAPFEPQESEEKE